MSLCYSHLSRRISAIPNLYSSPRIVQLSSRLARNVSSATNLCTRSNANRQRIQHTIRPRYLSTDTSDSHLSKPPVPVHNPEIAIQEAPRDDSDSLTPPLPPTSTSLHADTLPVQCPGCGAYAQTIASNEPGFYSRTRKKTKQQWHKRQQAIAKEQKATSSPDGVVTDDGAPEADTIRTAEELQDETALLAAKEYIQSTAQHTQICDRCHDLLHHNKGVSIPSPTIDSIAAYLEESPHRTNRVYHVIDAADFPMSLIPDIYDALDLQDQRSRNRRSKTEKYKYGKRMTTISFVITRADLLAATKEQVDSLMKRVREIILKKLHMRREDVRLGNVYMISAHRGWWTTQLKEEIRQHGGGVWIVGKANVGKSSFIETCFPKDSKNLDKIAHLLETRKQEDSLKAASAEEEAAPYLDPDALLPPAPREELYPTLPVVSSLPGTTVGPIRIPFGRGHGEMIDLPGLDRGTLQDFMSDEHKQDLIMTKRINPPEQLSIRPRQSLLIGGGLVRITPADEDSIILAACFVPLDTHVTRTEKAIEIQSGVRKYNTGGGDKGTSVIAPEHLSEEATTIRSAGTFTLSTDVTLSHLPSMIRKKWDDHGIRPNLDTLPYRVYAIDILIEGCGWIELTAQVRTKAQDHHHHQQLQDLPRIEVFTPLGKHIASRPPLETWNFIRDRRKAEKRKRFTSGAHRPRRGNISHKKRTLHGSKGA